MSDESASRPGEDGADSDDQAADDSREALVAEADQFLNLSGADVETPDDPATADADAR